MPIEVSDSASNKPENIQHAAQAIGRSKPRRKVFEAVYFHKQKVKTIAEIVEFTKLPRKRVLEEAVKLAKEHVIEPTKVAGRLAYKRREFLAAHKAKILRIAGNNARIDAIQTKRGSAKKIHLQISVGATENSAAKRISIDDIKSFAKVKKIKSKSAFAPIDESLIKEFFRLLLDQRGEFKDWGGETNDLFSSHLRITAKRKVAAFAFKGKATKGTLTPAKMGKNGDQIQRLFTAQADIFFVVYWGSISESVHAQMTAFANLRARMTRASATYCIVDGQDLIRLFEAYPDKLAKARRNLARKR